MGFIKQGSDTTLKIGPLLDSSGTPVTGLTLASSDCKLSKTGGAFASKTSTGSPSEDAFGIYNVPVTGAADVVSTGRFAVLIEKAGTLPWRGDWTVLASAIFDAWISGTSAQQVELTGTGIAALDQQIQDSVTAVSEVPTLKGTLAAVGTPSGGFQTVTLDASAVSATDYYKPQSLYLSGGPGAGQSRAIESQAGRVLTVKQFSATLQPTTSTTYTIDWGNQGVDPATVTLAGGSITNSTFAAGAIDANALATDAITAAKIATDAIGSAEVSAAAVTKIQSGLATAAGLTSAVSPLATTSALTTAQTSLTAINADTDDIQSRLTTAQTSLTTINADTDDIQTRLTTLQADTDDIQTRIPTALSPGGFMKADVEAMAANTVTGTALATSAVTKIADGVGTRQVPESYAADGVEGTQDQMLYMIQQMLTQFAIVGSTWTVYKLDGTTIAAIFDMNSPSAPTVLDRSS